MLAQAACMRRRGYLEKQQIFPVNPLFSVLAELVLDEVLRLYRIEQLKKEIDDALLSRDEEKFLKLSTELRMLKYEHGQKEKA